MSHRQSKIKVQWESRDSVTWVGLVIQGAEGTHPMGRGVQLYGMRKMGKTWAEGGLLPGMARGELCWKAKSRKARVTWPRRPRVAGGMWIPASGTWETTEAAARMDAEVLENDSRSVHLSPATTWNSEGLYCLIFCVLLQFKFSGTNRSCLWELEGASNYKVKPPPPPL